MQKSKTLLYIKSLPPEIYFWVAGLFALAFMVDPYAAQHTTICPLALVGIEWCWGCGIGRSIAVLFRLDFVTSFSLHPLGLPALVIIGHRIVSLLKNQINTNTYHHKTHPS